MKVYDRVKLSRLNRNHSMKIFLKASVFGIIDLYSWSLVF